MASVLCDLRCRRGGVLGMADHQSTLERTVRPNYAFERTGESSARGVGEPLGIHPRITKSK